MDYAIDAVVHGLETSEQRAIAGVGDAIAIEAGDVALPQRDDYRDCQRPLY